MSEVTTTAPAAATSEAAPEVKDTATVVTAAQAAPEVKVEEKKETTPTAEVKVVPEKYDLKLSEGSILDKGVLEKIAETAKQQGLSQEEAQALVGKQEAYASEFISERSTAWKKASEADKEIGGESFAQNAELAKRGFERFATPELKAEMEKTGFGNHPEVIRLFMRVGKAMADDKFVHANTQNTQAKSASELFYPKK